MADQPFWQAYKVVPIILAAYLTNAWAGYANFGILIHKKTIEIMYGTLIGAIVISVAYIVLIPVSGTIGAAWATVAGFGSRFIWIYWRAKKLYDMQLQWRKIGLLLLIGIVATVASIHGPEDLPFSISLNILLITGVFVSFMLLPIFPAQHRRIIMQIMKRPWRFNIILKTNNS